MKLVRQPHIATWGATNGLWADPDTADHRTLVGQNVERLRNKTLFTEFNNYAQGDPARHPLLREYSPGRGVMETGGSLPSAQRIISYNSVSYSKVKFYFIAALRYISPNTNTGPYVFGISFNTGLSKWYALQIAPSENLRSIPYSFTQGGEIGTFYGPVLVSQRFYIIEIIYDPDVPLHALYVDGVEEGSVSGSFIGGSHDRLDVTLLNSGIYNQVRGGNAQMGASWFSRETPSPEARAWRLKYLMTRYSN